MTKKLPKTLYIKWADGGTGDEWLHATSAMADLVEMGEEVEIGLYRLAETWEAEGVVSTKKVTK